MIRYVTEKREDSFTNNATPSPVIGNLGPQSFDVWTVSAQRHALGVPCMPSSLFQSLDLRQQKIYNRKVSIFILHSYSLIHRLLFAHQTNKSKFISFKFVCSSKHLGASKFTGVPPKKNSLSTTFHRKGQTKKWKLTACL